VPRAPDPSCALTRYSRSSDWDIWSVAPTEAWLALPPSMCNIYPPLDRDRRANLENPHDRSIRESWKEPRQAPRPAAGCLSRTCTCSSTTRPGPRDIVYFARHVWQVGRLAMHIPFAGGRAFVRQTKPGARSLTHLPPSTYF
jgi:hypothetical protein